MYRGNCTITTATEEVENGCFGTNGSCEIPSILSHSEFATLHQSIINEDYSLNMYADIIDGIVSPPSASNNIERNNLEAYVRNPFDDFITGHPRPTSTSNYTKTLQVKGKRCPVKGLKKTGLRSTKTANVSSREVLKAYRIVHPSVSKDGHTKVATSRGLRDRRIRLSFETAIKFFVIQDRLGFDQPSKALEWLLEKSRHAIDELPTISPSGFGDSLSSSMTANPHRSQWRIENLGLTDKPYTLQEQPINNVWARDPVDERAHICSCLNPSLNYGKCEIQSSSVNHVLNWKATAFNQ